jgi:hypothetical protein
MKKNETQQKKNKNKIQNKNVLDNIINLIKYIFIIALV